MQLFPQALPFEQTLQQPPIGWRFSLWTAWRFGSSFGGLLPATFFSWARAPVIAAKGA